MVRSKFLTLALVIITCSGVSAKNSTADQFTASLNSGAMMSRGSLSTSVGGFSVGGTLNWFVQPKWALGAFCTGALGFGLNLGLVGSIGVESSLALGLDNQNHHELMLSAQAGKLMAFGVGPIFFPIFSGGFSSYRFGPKVGYTYFHSPWVGFGAQIGGAYVLGTKSVTTGGNISIPGFYLAEVSGQLVFRM